MLRNTEIKKMYEKIQKQLFYMIPEKWDRVYLYASVIDHFNNVQTGEMFFYYYPKSVIKKNPVNVYEVPNKFNIDEQAYLKLAERLYYEIKKLRSYEINVGEKAWSNLTISVQDFKFSVEYDYDDLVNSKYTNVERHLIWRYKYLDIPLNSYTRKDRKMIEEYLKKEKYKNQNVNTYVEGIYKKPVSNLIEYDKQEEQEEIITDTVNEVVKLTKNKEQKNKENKEKKQLKEQENTKEDDGKVTSQILTFKP